MQSPKLGSVLIVLHRVGPYHHARFQAAASVLTCPLLVLQTRPQSQEYPRDFVVEGPTYTLLSLEGANSSEQDPPKSILRHQLEELLERYQPSVIVSVGWADQAYLQLMLLAQQRSVPLVVVSDSRRQDSARSPWKEWLKRQLIRGYSAGVVAGTQSRAYLRQLGMKAEAIQQPWDVVDNNRFAKLASEAALSSQSHSNKSPFLCVARFIPEKNHALLLKAYALYQLEGGTRNLVLIGNGPLEQQIRANCDELIRPSAVKLLPFAQLERLATYYSKACALILPSKKDTWGLVVNEAMASGLPVIVSSACGCVDDLIQHGVSGWSFPPDDILELVRCLKEAEALNPEQRLCMADRARSRLMNFSPESFAEGLQNACNYALEYRKHSFRSMFFAHLLHLGN